VETIVLLRVIIALCLIPVFLVLGVYNAIWGSRMVDKLNAILPADRRFDAWEGWHHWKRAKFWKEFDRNFPNDDLRTRHRLAASAAAGVVVLFVWLMLS
jgi:hypothetical protein